MFTGLITAVLIAAGSPSPPTSPDFNHDGFVNAVDLAMLLDHWGPCSAHCPFDLTADGAVDVSDLLALLGYWGSAAWPGPTGLTATAVSATQINLQWDAMAPTPSLGYSIERSPGNQNQWSLIATEVHTTAFFDTLTPGNPATYDYRVAAVTDAGPTTWSDTASATTLLARFAPFCYLLDEESGLLTALRVEAIHADHLVVQIAGLTHPDFGVRYDLAVFEGTTAVGILASANVTGWKWQELIDYILNPANWVLGSPDMVFLAAAKGLNLMAVNNAPVQVETEGTVVYLLSGVKCPQQK